MDFAFITDHQTIAQKRECTKHENLWWGQEPGAGLHHLGVLARAKKYVPAYVRRKKNRPPLVEDLQQDFDALRDEHIFFFRGASNRVVSDHVVFESSDGGRAGGAV